MTLRFPRWRATSPSLLRIAALACTALLLASCGDDSGAADTATSSETDATVESSAANGGSGTSADVHDSHDTSAQESRAACEQAVASAEGVSVTPPGEVAVQGALASARRDDGEPSLLVAWSGASGHESNLAPLLAPLDCADGEWFGQPPMRLNPDVEINEGQPKLAARGDRALAVWQRADGSENQVRMVLLDADGQVTSGAPRHLEALLGDEQVAGRTWQPSAAALADGRFAVAATFADPGWASFRTYVAVLDDGLDVAQAIALYAPAPEESSDGNGGEGNGNGGNGNGGEDDDEGEAVEQRWHEAPVLAAADDGRLWVAWDDRSNDKDDVSVVLLTPDGAGEYTAGTPVRVLPDEENAVASPALAVVDHPDGQRAWMAVSVFSGNAAAMLLDVTDPESISAPLVVQPRERAFRTTLAPAGDRVLVAWQARDGASSARGHLFAQWMRVDGDSLARAGDRIELNLQGRRTHLAYPLAIATHGERVALTHTSSSPDSGWRTHLHLLSP